MEKQQIEQLQKLSKVFNTNSVLTQQDISDVVKGLASILKGYRLETEEISKETKEALQSVVALISDEHDKVLASVEKTSETVKSEATEALTKALDEVKKIAQQVLEMKPKDGEPGLDADEEVIVEKVLGKIVLPEYKETVLDTPEELVKKLETLKEDDRLDASAIKNLPEFGGSANGGGWRNLSLMHDVDLLDPTDGQVLTYDGDTDTWKNENATGGGGTWGSITGTLSDQTDLQTALNAKQDTLVSGTNIKTINGASLLGSGDISISGVGTGTANTIAYWGTTTSIASLATATYPDLTELSYVKGVTSAIQTQLNARALAATTITIAGTANQITSSAGAQDLSANRTWTLSFPSDVIIPTVLTVPNTGLHLLDSNATHDLIIKPGSNLSADRTFTLTTGDTDMIVDFTAVTDEYVLAYDTATNTWRGVAASGGGTPGGSDLELQYNNAGSFGGMAGTAWNATNRTLNWTTATVTTSDPILDLAQTWNSAGVTFTGLKFNVTNTASAAASILADLQVGGTSLVHFPRVGGVRSGGLGTGLAGYATFSQDGGGNPQIFRNTAIVVNFDSGVQVGNTGYFGFSANFTPTESSADIRLVRDAANSLAQRRTTQSQTFRVYKTYTDASNYERLSLNGTATSNWLQLAAETAGTGGDNLNLALTPSGTGALSAQVPDSGTGGGNARGANSVDFQTSRGAAAHVASASTSTLSGGRNNTSSGVDGWIPGGNYGTTRGLIGAYAYANGRFAADGDAQVIGQVVRNATTNATPTVLTADAGAAGATNIMVLPNSSVYGFTAKVWAISGSNAGYWEVRGTMYRGANAAATALIGTTTVQAFGVSAALSTAVVDVIADTTNGGAVIQVTGIAATNINWGGELSGGQGI